MTAALMTLREGCTPVQLRAHAVLDRVRAGLWVHPHLVAMALVALGEPVQ